MKISQKLLVGFALSILFAGSLSLISIFARNPNFTFNPQGQVAAISGSGSGLIAHYTFDSVSATSVTDASGNGRTLALVGNPTQVAGKVGSAIEIDGADDYLVLDNAQSPRSVSMWFKTTEKSVLYQGNGLSLVSSASYSNTIDAYLTNLDGSFKTRLTSASPVFDGQGVWKHIVWTEENGVGKIYINGELDNSLSFTLNSDSTGKIAFGVGLYGGYEPFGFSRVALDDIRLYSRGLNQAEVSEIYSLTDSGGGGGGGSVSPDVTAPIISGVMSSPGSTSVTISWTTDEASDSQVEYGLTQGYGNSTTLDSSLTTSHSVAITGLDTNTTHYFRVRSKDASGNIAYSSLNTFTTSSGQAQTYSLSIEKNGTGSGTVTGGSINCGSVCSAGELSAGASVTLSASPASGSTFSGWSGGGCTGTGTCTVSISANTIVQANFTSATGQVTGAPTVPLVIGAVGVSAKQINISWETSLGGPEAAKYNVYRNGSFIGSVSTLSEDDIWKDPGMFQDVGLAPATTYSYFVKAVSASNVESGPTRTVTATTQSGSQVGIIPPSRLYDWTPGVNVGVPGGIPTNRTNIIDISQAPYFASGSVQTTTGTIAKGSNQLTVVSPIDFRVGQRIFVKNASTNYYVDTLIVDLYTSITAINGNTITLADPAKAAATNTLVEHDDGSIINQAIAEAPNNSVIYLPPGIYKGSISIGRNNVTVRGAGVDVTTIDCTGTCGVISKGDGFYNAPDISITSGAFAGSKVITVADASNIGVGTMIRISADNDKSLPVISVTGYQNIRSQNSVVTAKSGNTLTINPPIMWGPLNKPVIKVSAGYVNLSGIEDLTLDGSKAAPTFATILGNAYGCWYKNVKIKGAGNYTMTLGGLMNEIRHSYFDEQTGGGTNHAGLLTGDATGFLFEDNIVLKAQPLIEINGSASGVIAYNFMTGGVANINHGPHNQYNLYEGNYMEGMISDGYFGGESETSIFRNWITGSIALKRFSRNFNIVGNQLGGYSLGQPNIGNGSSEGTVAPSAGVYWADWNPTTGPGIRGTITARQSDSQVTITLNPDSIRLFGICAALGNCMSLGVEWSTGTKYGGESSRTANTITVGSGYGPPFPSVGTVVGLWPRSEGFQEKDLDVLTTLILKHNIYPSPYSNGAGGYLRGVNESLQSGETLPNSLYLDSKPAWFGTMQWPPYGPYSPSYNRESIPAGYRYYHPGSEAPGVTNTGSGPVQTSFTLTVTKGGTGSGTVSGSTISCGSTCSKTAIPTGTSITLTASPASGSTFTGWSGGGCTGTGSCTVTILTHTTVTATFASASQVSNGSCGTLENTCTTGTLQDTTDTTTAKKWNCVGLNGGTTASCSLAITTDPVNPPGGTPDTTAPSMSITAPANNATVSGTAVVLSATASDNIALHSVQWKLDGNDLGDPLTVAPYSGTWNSTLTSNGTHTLSATARDTSGNTKASSVTVKVSNVVAPDTTAPSVPTGLVSSSITQTSATLSWTPSTDNTAVNSYRVYQGGTLIASPLSNSYVIPGLSANTSYSFTVSAVDAAGNTSSQSSSITIRTSATPVTTYTLTTTKTGLGRITGPGISCGSSCSTTVTPNTKVTLTASPSSEYTFANWTGACSGKSPTCTLTITTNTLVGVVFVDKGTGVVTGSSQPFTPTVPQKPPTSGTTLKLTRDFGVGAVGEDVRSLQKFLNATGYKITSSGAGSPGQETTLFGGLTRAAVVRYQIANGISGTGYVGPLTRAKIAGTTTTTTTSKPATTTTKPTTTTPPKTTTTTSQPSTSGSLYLTVPTTLTQTLALGAKGGEVVLLQQILSSLVGIYPEKKQTGSFDSATELAVQRFQVKYGLSKAGDSGYGIVGPTTRAKLNEVRKK